MCFEKRSLINQAAATLMLLQAAVQLCGKVAPKGSSINYVVSVGGLSEVTLKIIPLHKHTVDQIKETIIRIRIIIRMWSPTRPM